MKKQKIEGELVYNKHNSFYSFKSKKEMDKEGLIKKINSIHKKKIGLNNIKPKNLSVLQKTIDDLNLKNQISNNKFYISPNVADEILTLEDNEVLNYLVHRYRYELFRFIIGSYNLIIITGYSLSTWYDWYISSGCKLYNGTYIGLFY